MGFEPGTFGIQAQSSATELQGNLEKVTEILSRNNKVNFGPPDFPIRVSYFIYHSASYVLDLDFLLVGKESKLKKKKLNKGIII